MKFLIACLLLGVAAQQAYAEELFDDALVDHEVAEGRIFGGVFNVSSTATSLTLLGALILLGVIAYLIYAGGLLGDDSGYNRNGYNYGYQDEQYGNYEQYAQYR